MRNATLTLRNRATLRLAAKEYVDKQLATMRRYGSAPRDLSDGEYQGLIEEVLRTTIKARGNRA